MSYLDECTDWIERTELRLRATNQYLASMGHYLVLHIAFLWEMCLVLTGDLQAVLKVDSS